jgi:acetyl-CoA carboxylase carboxyl transferase subunit alpha
MLDDLQGMDAAALIKARREKFLAMGSKGLAA